jgi:hypothetical protein
VVTLPVLLCVDSSRARTDREKQQADEGYRVVVPGAHIVVLHSVSIWLTSGRVDTNSARSLARANDSSKSRLCLSLSTLHSTRKLPWEAMPKPSARPDV